MRWRLTPVLCLTVVSLSTLVASYRRFGSHRPLAFPHFPHVDDTRVVSSSDFTATIDKVLDDDDAAAIEMTHMRVRSEISMRYARTAIICNVYNPRRKPQEASFNLLLPETAFISGFTMTLGKETYEAYVKEKEVAKKIYSDAVSQGVAAAHIATKARDSNHFTIKFNVEGRSNATYRLRYEEFLTRRNGVYNHAINLHPGTCVPKMDVVIHIKESQKITALRVPELRSGNEIDATEKDAQYAKAIIKRGRNEREATISFSPDLEEQTRLSEIYAEKSKQSSDPESLNIGFDSTEQVNDSEGLLGQFVVQYDVQRPKKGEILVNDGYFVHFFAPSSMTPLSKHVVFVLDTSGSMLGSKIEQLQKAMNSILSDLRPTDCFNVVEFNSNVKVHDLKDAEISSPPNTYSFNLNSPVDIVPPALATPENIDLARITVSRLSANGGTNIYKALHVALNVIHNKESYKNQENPTNITSVERNKGTDKNKNVTEPLIIFLTDGEPTVEEFDTDRIVSSVSGKNSDRTPIYTLAFGDSADRYFLRKLALRNDGFMRHIYEASDAALQLHDFYRQVSSPLLSNVQFQYPRRQIKEESLSRHQFRTINDGSEVAVVGRVADGVQEITPQVLGLRAESDGRGRKPYEVNSKVTVTQDKDEYLPLERLWAYMTIKQLLDKSYAEDKSQIDSKDSPEKKALAIALKYSFVTPLTSLVVVRLNKTEVDDVVDAETVDDPKFLPYRKVRHSKLQSLTYSGTSTGDGLTVSSIEGPVLFVQSNRRLTGGAASGVGSSYGGGFSGTHSGHHFGIAHHGGKYGQYGGYGHNSGSGTNQNSGAYSGAQGYGAYETSTDGYGGWGNAYASSRPSLPFSTATTTITSTTTASADLRTVYHLEGYEWALANINASEDALEWNDERGSQVTLKLSKDSNLPQNFRADYQCKRDEPTQSPEVRCVYLTRCFAARNYTLIEYQYNYCYVNDGYLYYAGACCPINEIDKIP
ncbi:inter-alpha-trypsin inhibitor heavy chain H3 isoform X3 [Bicyclus anynana]|uniref:Inter-alpha-trypsin inhibitor heavy chain H3 isoform X2 n=1 Tax=Bicyclus anynana TaxID=110368 RepID=A0ABM3M7J5_BICAN|nr:inter-alpha-trypsin inhibitor heavy chain H3 isoform X2 [Bicyclus anynana]XP_052747418.1 inter-alpha-trypsin inhibitor heavy chain H3 isoform X3 [Bicyclus anynana]